MGTAYLKIWPVNRLEYNVLMSTVRELAEDSNKDYRGRFSPKTVTK